MTSALGALAALLAGLAPAPAIDVPAGYRAETFATGLTRPTAIAWAPDGVLYATQETGEVVAVGRGSSRPTVVARGFRTPLGPRVRRGPRLRLGAGDAVAAAC